jgi:hypothetical protein
VENREPKLRCSCIQRLFGRKPAATSPRVSLTGICEELARSRATATDIPKGSRNLTIRLPIYFPTFRFLTALSENRHDSPSPAGLPSGKCVVLR